MSRESVEIVRRAIEAAWRKPKPDFELVNALYDPDHEFIARLSGVEGHAFRGATGFRKWMTLMDETLERWRIRLDSIEDLDDNRVLVDSVIAGQSRLAGVPFEQRVVFIATVSAGRVVRTESFRSVQEARAAVTPPSS